MVFPKFFLALIFVVSISTLYAKECTEKQIARMILSGISQKTIDAICMKEETKKPIDTSKQIIVNITNAPVNTNSNVNTPNNTSIASSVINTQLLQPKSETEYFLWRIGFGYMGIKEIEFSSFSINLGIQYFINGVNTDGFGIGWSISSSSAEYERTEYYSSYTKTINYTLHKVTSEFEMMYNFSFKSGYTLVPIIIIGRLNSTAEAKNKEELFEEDDSKITGFGLYLNFPSIVKSGQGLSLSAKYLMKEETRDSEAENITLVSFQFAW